MKKQLLKIIKYLITTVLFLLALYKANVFNESGQKELWSQLKNANTLFVVLSVTLMFILNLSSSVKWFVLIKRRIKNIVLWRVYAYYNIGKFFNLIFPTSFGGDVIRIIELGKFTGEKNIAAASVIVERFTGLMTLMLFAIIAIIINIKVFNQVWLSVSLLSGTLFLILLSWIVLSKKFFASIRVSFANNIFLFNKILDKIEKIRQPILEYKSDKKAIIWAIINSVIFQLLAVINVWISSLAFGNELTFITCLAAVPVILFIMNIPLSIGGIGLMEFSYVFTLSLFGASPALAISTALLIRGKNIIDSLIGGIIYLLLNEGKSLPRTVNTE